MKWMSFIRYLFSLNILLGLTLAFSSSSYGATFILENADAPNKGLNNKKAVSPVGGNPGTTLGGQRRRVFEAVFDLLEGTIESDVEIRVKVSFDPLACERYSGQVGGAGPIGVASDFSGAPEPDVLYPIALANRHAGLDLEPDYADIEVIINRSIDFNNDCLYRTNFYYGLDGREPARKINLFTIVLHEVIHGLGFLSLADIDGSFLFDLKDPFSQYIYDDQYNKYWPEMTNAQRADSYDNSYNVTWRGPEITFRGENVGGTANESYWNGQYLRYPYLYAPSPIEPGSSISHWNDITPDQLMEPYTTGPVVEVSDYERAALLDLGWPLTNPLPIIDTDGDGVRDRDDHFPWDPNESQDNDGDRIGDNIDTDDDNDGMDDDWESSVGLDPFVDDAAEDPDGDNWTNAEEYVVRTNPYSNQSAPEPLTFYYENFSNSLPASWFPFYGTSSDPVHPWLVNDGQLNADLSISPNEERIIQFAALFPEGAQIRFSFEIPTGCDLHSRVDVIDPISHVETRDYYDSGQSGDIQFDVPEGLKIIMFRAWQWRDHCNPAELLITIDDFYVLTSGHDQDGDGISDIDEVDNGLDALDANDASLDADSDGLTNLDEFVHSTGLYNPDSDEDGLMDGEEVHTHSSDPLLADTDHDGIRDDWELLYGLDLLESTDANQDADNDGYTNLEEFRGKSDPLLDTSTPKTDWITYQGNAQHSGYVPITINAHQLLWQWSKTIGDNTSLHSVVTSDDKVLVSSDGISVTQTLTALDLSSGTELWQHDFGAIHNLSGPAISEGKVFVQTGGHEDTFLYGFETDSGNIQTQKVFTNQFTGFLAPTPFYNDIYISGGYTGGAYSFNTLTGEQRWFNPLPYDDYWTPAVNDSHIFVCLNSEFMALNRQTGLKAYGITEASCQRRGGSANPGDYRGGVNPILGDQNNALIIGKRAPNRDLLSFDLTTKTVDWKIEGDFSSTPSVGRGLVAAINDGVLAIFSESEGSLLWSWASPAGRLQGNTVLTKNHIFTTTSDTTYAVNLQTHQQEWSYAKSGRLAINKKMLFISSSDGTLTAIALLDSDNDGLSDIWELEYGLNPENSADAVGDLDGDNLNNLQEYQNRSNPRLTDTDGDTLSDYDEAITHGTSPVNQDTDSDTLPDNWELTNGFDPLNAADAAQDFDDDGLTNLEEYNNGWNPRKADSDDDGLGDNWEVTYGLDPIDPTDALEDMDGDGLSNLNELLANLDPTNTDSDNDGLTDGDEVNIHGTDPTSHDSDGDILPDRWEVQYGFNPLNPADSNQDDDTDGYTNVEEFGGKSDPLIGTSIPISPQPWHTYQGNAQHTGYVPITVNPVNNVEQWSKTISDGHTLHPVVTFNGQVFVSSYYGFGDQKLSALDLINGTELWQHDFGDINRLSGPAISEGKVFVQTGGHEDTFLYGFETDSGNIEIQRAFGNQWSQFIAPTPFGSDVYIQGGYYGGAYSFNAITGEENWFNNLALRDNWTPTVNDNHIFGCLGNELIALNRQTGIKAYGITGTNCSRATLALGANNNALVIGTWPSEDLISFDLTEQTIAWSVEGTFVGTPTVGLGLVVAINNDVLAVHSETNGSLLWDWTPPTGNLIGNSVLTNSHVFVSTSDTTYAINLQTHEQNWSYGKGGHIVVSTGHLYISSSDGTLSVIAFDTDSDGIADNWELEYGLDPKNPADASEDLDGDNLTNLQEYQEGSNPTLTDSDGDTLSDYDEVTVHTTSPIKQDTDNDGMRDDWEVGNGFDPLDPTDAAMDADGDNATNLEEYGQGTNPTSSDSDGDGIDDGFEIANGLNPLIKDSSGDRDDDGFSNLEEFIAGSNPLDETDKPADPELTFGNQLCSFNTDAITASIHPQSDKAYIPNRASNTIDIITVTRVGCVSKSIPTAGEPQDVAFSEDGSKYFVTIDSAQELHIYDVETDELTNAIPLPATGYEVVAGSGTIYVSGLNTHQGIMRIDAATEVYIDSFGSGNLAYTKVALELSPNAKRLFFANRNTGSYVPGVLSVYDVSGEIPLLLNTTYPAGVLGPDGRSLSVDPINGTFVSYATAGQYSYGGDTSGKIYKLPSDDFFAPSGHFLTGASAKVIEYSHNGTHAYTVNTSDEIKVWNSNEFTLEETLTVSGEARDVVESWSQRYLVVPTDESLQILYLREDGGSCFNHACDPNSWWRFKLIQP